MSAHKIHLELAIVLLLSLGISNSTPNIQKPPGMIIVQDSESELPDTTIKSTRRYRSDVTPDPPDNANTDLQEELKELLNLGVLSDLDLIWKKYKEPYETLITQSLKESFGKESLNLFPRVHEQDLLKIAEGFHAFDDAVDIIFTEMKLLNIPWMETVDQSLSLVYGTYFLSASLSSIHVFTKYHMFKINNDIQYAEGKPGSSKASPFTFQQVQNTGDLTITADRCKLSGNAVLNIIGSTVSLGHTNFMLTDCEFTVEISTPGLGSPPVFAPYFERDQAQELMRLISRPMRDMVSVRLENIFFSFINITSIFGEEDANTLSNTMQSVSMKSSDYFDIVIRSLNKPALEVASVVKVDEFSINFTAEINGEMENLGIRISNVSISGLETAHSSHSGGIFFTSGAASAYLYEAVSFSGLHVVGEYSLKMDESLLGSRTISIEVHDASAHISLELFDGATRKMKHHKTSEKNKPRVEEIKFIGWSRLEFELFDRDLDSSIRQQIKSTISGYLSHAIPTYITRYLRNNLQSAVDNSYPMRYTNMKGKKLDPPMKQRVYLNKSVGKKILSNDSKDSASSSGISREETSNNIDILYYTGSEESEQESESVENSVDEESES